MPETINATLGTVTTDRERNRRAALEQEERGSILGAVGAAFDETIPAVIVRDAARDGFAPDLEYQLDQQRFSELSAGVDPSLWPMFGEAVSAEHAQAIRAQALQLTDSRRQLAELGWKGTALTTAAQFLDPVNLAVGFATAGAGAAATGGRAARIGAALRSGTVSSLSMAGVEGYRASQDPSYTATDVARSAIAGFGFGAAGPLGAGMGRGARFLVGGAAAAGPSAAFDAALASIDNTRGAGDVMWTAAGQFLFGGVLNAVPPTRALPTESPMPARTAPIDEMGRRWQKRVELEEIQAVGGELTPKGRAAFAAARDVAGERSAHAATIEAAVVGDLGSDAATVATTPAPRRRDVEIDDAVEFSRISKLSVRQFKSDLPDGYRYTNEVGIGARLTDEGVVELGPKFFDKSIRTNDRVAMLQDAASGGALGAGGFDVLFFESARQLSREAGKVSASLLQRRIKGLTYEQAKVLANRLRAIDLYNARRSPAPAADGTPAELMAAPALSIGTSESLPTLASPEIPTPKGLKSDIIAAAVEAEAKASSPFGGGKGSAGAASQKDIQAETDRINALNMRATKKRATDLDLSGVNDSYTSGVRVLKAGGFDIGIGRGDMPGMVGRSDVPEIRRVNNMIGPDPLPKADGSPSPYTAPEWARDSADIMVAKLFTRNDAIYGDYVAATKKSGGKPLTREAFMREVTRAQRRARGVYSTDPFINQAADNLRGWYKEHIELSQAMGVKGLRNVEASEQYVPVIGNRPVMDAKLAELDTLTGGKGLDLMHQLVAEAIMLRSENLDADKAVKFAKAWVKNVGTSNRGNEIGRSGLFSADMADDLAEAIKDAIPSATKAEIEDLIYATVKRNEETNTISRAKRRLDMDHTHSIELPNGARLSVEDLLVNDAESMARLYTRQVHGAAAMAEVYANVSNGPDDVIENIDQLIRRLRQDAESRGVKADDIETELKKIEVMAKITAGIPLSPDSATQRAFRIIQGGNFIRLMSGVGTGIQNFSDFAHTVSTVGFGAIMRQLPTLGQLFKRASNGDLDNALLREFQTIVSAAGQERSIHRVLPHYGVDESGGVTMGKLETMTAKGQRLAADVSLQSLGTRIMQPATGALIEQRWLDVALSGKSLSDKRLAGLGLTRDMADRISDQMTKNATKEKGAFGWRLVEANIGKWKDVEAAMKFRAALSKESRRLVLLNNPAAYAKWMTHPAGRALAQLRTFAFGAWTNKLLYEVHMRDAQAFVNLGVATATAGMTYVLRTYLDSVGKPESEQFLRDRLAPDKIALASFSRAAYSSLIPTAVDTVWGDMMRRPPVFSYARTTGLQGGALFGNPTIDTIGTTMRMPSAMFGWMMDDYDFSKQDVRTLRDGLWVPRVVGVYNVIDQLSRNLPETSQENRQ